MIKKKSLELTHKIELLLGAKPNDIGKIQLQQEWQLQFAAQEESNLYFHNHAIFEKKPPCSFSVLMHPCELIFTFQCLAWWVVPNVSVCSLMHLNTALAFATKPS